MAAVVVLAVPVFSLLVAFVSALANFAVAFASALAVLVAGDVVFVLPVALTVVAFGPPFAVFGAALVVFGPPFAVFGPALVVFGPLFVVFGDEIFVVVPFDDTCGFGVDPFLPCAGTVTDEASTNATAIRSTVNVRVMNPPMEHGSNPGVRCKWYSSWVARLSLADRAISKTRRKM